MPALKSMRRLTGRDGFNLTEAAPPLRLPLCLRLARIVVSALFGLFVVGTASAADMGTLKQAANGVTVAVTPTLLDKSSIEFKVVLDTHSQDLSDDLMKTAALFDAAGNRYSPLAWDGAGPGGHHREGVLRFGSVAPTSRLELQILRTGEERPRVFRWQLE